MKGDYESYTDNQYFYPKRNNKSWHLRNDSSGVSAALCTNCYCNNCNYKLASMPNILTSKKVLISSKKHCGEQCCSKNVQRKPVKECYCYPESKKLQLRSLRTQHKRELPCKHCKSHADLNPSIIKEDTEQQVLDSPISCETLRRVRKIDYAPKSQFLRNVQSKVSILQSAGDHPGTCFRSPYYHELMVRKNVHNIDPMHHSTVDKESQTNNYLTKSRSVPKMSENSETNEEEQSSGTDSEDIRISLNNQLKPKLITKRTLTSKKSVPDVKKTKSNSKALIKSKKTLQPHHKGHPYSQSDKAETSLEIILEKDPVDSEDYKRTAFVHNGQGKNDRKYVTDKELKELRKFREQNYFDTHGSNHTLLSSRSSGSLEQYLLNDRLFPELAKRIHKKDLVVTMPACATLQRKRIHYFPRYIVRQEKSNCNTNYKKKRCQSCPLTGHSIDLGVTKIRSPLNSLALKYQKRLP